MSTVSSSSRATALQNRPRIAMVYDAIYPYSKGGGERRFYELGRRLVGMGYDVHWYGMQYWDGPSTIDNDGITLHGLCKARPLYIEGGRRSISQALIFGLSAFKLIGARFDVIDCCGFPYFSLFPAKLATLLRRKPLYATWHEVWGRKYWDEYLGVLGIVGATVERVASMLPTTIIAAGPRTARLLHDTLGVTQAKRVEVVANGIDTAAMQYIKPAPAKQQSDIIYVGRLMDYKNVQLIIEALAIINGQSDKKLTVAIVGDGPAKEALHALAKKLRVNSHITWHGFVEDSNEVYGLMKASKVFVLPSKREGFGIVAVEANACGLPVLTADFPDNAAADLITPGRNGYVFEPNAVQLARAIQKTLKTLPSLQTHALKAGLAYDWDALAKQLATVYGLR